MPVQMELGHYGNSEDQPSCPVTHPICIILDPLPELLHWTSVGSGHGVAPSTPVAWRQTLDKGLFLKYHRLWSKLTHRSNRSESSGHFTAVGTIRIIQFHTVRKVHGVLHEWAQICVSSLVSLQSTWYPTLKTVAEVTSWPNEILQTTSKSLIHCLQYASL